MKRKIQLILQHLLGYEQYLFAFCVFKIIMLRLDKRERGFLYFLKILPEDSIVLDIGANLGYMSAYFSKKLKHGQVIAFEPVLYNYKVLNKIINFFNLHNVKCFNLALGDHNNNIEMILPVDRGVRMQGLSRVYNTQSPQYIEKVEKFLVRQKKLDTINEIADLKISAIKIDVENYEYYVFKGGYSLIKANRPIIFAELWRNENFKKCCKLFEDIDYDMFVYVNKKLMLYDVNYHSKMNNFFLLPKELGSVHVN